jgi:hypothetical protein
MCTTENIRKCECAEGILFRLINISEEGVEEYISA